MLASLSTGNLYFSNHLVRVAYTEFRISDYQNKTVLDNITIYNKLQNKRNWISEWSKIKTSVPKQLVEKIKTLDTCTNKRKCKLYIDNNLFL